MIDLLYWRNERTSIRQFMLKIRPLIKPKIQSVKLPGKHSDPSIVHL